MITRTRFCWLLILALAAASQTARIAGTVTAVDAARRQITVHTDDGAPAVVALAEGAEILSLTGDARDLKSARSIALSEISPGDRVLARGAPASTLLVMSRQEVERKRAAERADWERRGVAGIITAVDAAARTVTVKTQTLAGVQPLVIVLSHDAVLRRYAPDSVKFSDARPGRFEDLQPGDQLRARGERSGDRLLAEEVVSGSFRTVAALFESFDPRTNTLRVKDLDGGRRLAVELRADSRLRRLPEPMARMLAARLSGVAQGTGAAPPPAGMPPAGPPQGSPFAGAPGYGPRGLESLLERLPPLKPEELKPGDAIVVSSTRGSEPARLAAITLLAGVEPLLESAPRQGRQAWLETWNLELNMNVGW